MIVHAVDIESCSGVTEPTATGLDDLTRYRQGEQAPISPERIEYRRHLAHMAAKRTKTPCDCGWCVEGEGDADDEAGVDSENDVVCLDDMVEESQQVA